MINDNFSVTGDVLITIFDEYGNVKEERNIKNLVVATGKQFIASKVASSGSLNISYMGIGTGSTSPVSTDTSLVSQILSRQPTAASYTSGSTQATFTASFPGTTYANSAVTEAGLFCSLTGGILVCRTIFGSITILSTDTIGISWTLSIL